ncbi:MAG: chromosomal replication initiator protein DnaA [Phycisphaeraceae bacterium]|nr:chromosomal replication initiator protein DnaA [Phycisphaeraceae bacterium]
MKQMTTALWRDMMLYLRRQHAPICRQWFEELRPGSMDGGLLTIHTTTNVQRNYLQKQCSRQFTEAAQAATGKLVAVQFDDRPIGPATAEPPATATSTPARGSATPRSAPITLSSGREDTDTHDQTVISPDYNFETFVTGPENALAHSAALAVTNQLGTTYNPLFIHGGVGLGKTHLLHAICQRVMLKAPETKICFLSCDAFVNQFLDAVQKGQMAQFQHRYRNIGMLVIDDIHFLANRERTQEEFFHTFNQLYQLNRQIVLSSDSPPSEIPQLEARLISRFQVGLVAPVSRLHFETRVAIIRSKAQLRGLELHDDVISLIATKIDSNARELEGAINTLQGYAALHQETIDLDLARKALGEPAAETNHATLQQVISAVTEYFDVRLSDLQSKRRHKSIAGPRQIAMWLARRHTRFSLEEIGGHFGGRDHTTVMHAIRAIDQRIKDDSVVARQVEYLQSRISSPGRLN